MIHKLLKYLVFIGVLNAVPAFAQQDMSGVEIKTQQLREGVYVLFGQGGNMGLATGAEANFLIDDQFAPLSDKILAAIAEISDQPLDFLVNTHWHGDHTGGNENMGKAGALIIAHDNVRERLKTGLDRGDGRVTPPAAPGALPVVTFSQTSSVHINGDRLHIIHVPHAHTDGDAVVHFTKANVIHMGDTFFNGRFPFIDVASGGNVNGVIAAADLALSLSNEDTLIIPGHGEVARKADLQRYRAMLVDVRDKVAKLIAEGKSREAVIAAKPSVTYDAQWASNFINPERFVGAVYDSLKN